MLTNIINSAEAISPQDITDIETFMVHEENHLKYIPEIIKNKENLATVTNLILKYHKEEPPMNVLLPKFNNVNDVLRLAIVLSGNSASDLGKSVRFKSFSNPERRMLMQLLNHCKNRYEDFLKYKNIWSRFCERVHPYKFKTIYPDLVNDLLGDYTYNFVDSRVEYKFYQNLYDYHDQLIKLSEDNHGNLSSSYSNTNPLQQLEKKLKNIKSIPEDIKNNIKNYMDSVRKDSNKGKIEKDTLSLLNKDLIQKRREELENEILILNEKARQYRHERQPFDSKVVELITSKKVDEAAKLLSQKPGIFLRHLDELITKSENHHTIIKLLEEIAPTASIKVLLSVKAYFQKRNEKLNYRAFLIKGSNGSRKPKIKNVCGKEIRRRRTVNNVKPCTVIYYTDKVKEPLGRTLCEEIIHICDRALVTKFENKSKLNGVYISPDLEKILIPQDLRGANNNGLESFTKGSRFDLSFKNITQEEKEQMIKDTEEKLEMERQEKLELTLKKEKLEMEIDGKKEKQREKSKMELQIIEDDLIDVNKSLKKIENKIKQTEDTLDDIKKSPVGINYNKIRLFIWWTNATNQTGNIIDISVLVFDENFNVKVKVAWNFLKSDDYQIYHSGDFIDGGKVDGKGVSEFIDLDTEAILAKGGRYVVVGVISYRGPNLDQFKNCKFGWMERQELKSNEFFEPASVRQKIDVRYSGKAACPAIIDCKTHEVIWIDTILAKTGDGLCIETLTKNIKAILSYYIDPIRLSMAELLRLHCEARDGTLLENEEDLKEGDTAFVPYLPYSKKENVKYITSSDLDIILSEYMNE